MNVIQAKLVFSVMLVHVYDYRAYFRGLRIDDKGEPPERWVQQLMQTIIQAAVFRQDMIDHECRHECALSNYIVLGYPYGDDVLCVVPR